MIVSQIPEKVLVVDLNLKTIGESPQERSCVFVYAIL